jgi:hypothetical protein
VKPAVKVAKAVVKPPVVAKAKPRPKPVPRKTGQAFQRAKPVICNETKYVMANIEHSKQISIEIGVANNDKVVIVTYVDPKTRNFTVVEHYTNKMSCYIFIGKQLHIDLKMKKPDQRAEG